MGRRGGGRRVGVGKGLVFLSRMDGGMQGKVAGMKEGKKETNGIELTNILHTSDLLYILIPFQ